MTMDTSSAAPRDRIVIAGGSGFIGQALAGALAADGHAVTVLTRGPTQGTAPGVRYLHWDGTTPDGACIEALRGARACVNLCGASIGAGRWTAARKRELIDSRVGPARALNAALARLDVPPALLLQASGVGYAGTGAACTDETTAPGHDFLARLAVTWEATLADAPVPATALRFGVVLGAGGALPRMLLPFRLWAGGPIGAGTQWLSWIHIDDAVAAIRFVIDRGLTGPVNVTAPNPVQNRAFATIAGRVLHRPALLPTPALALRVALGEQATLVCDGQRAVPARLLAAGFAFRYPELEPALRALCR
jgi:uncharacterized protein (TIGR01777 family)